MEEVGRAEALGPFPVAAGEGDPEDRLVAGLPDPTVVQPLGGYAAFALALASFEKLSLLSTGALLGGFRTSSAPPRFTKGP